MIAKARSDWFRRLAWSCNNIIDTINDLKRPKAIDMIQSKYPAPAFHRQ